MLEVRETSAIQGVVQTKPDGTKVLSKADTQAIGQPVAGELGMDETKEVPKAEKTSYNLPAEVAKLETVLPIGKLEMDESSSQFTVEITAPYNSQDLALLRTIFTAFKKAFQLEVGSAYELRAQDLSSEEKDQHTVITKPGRTTMTVNFEKAGETRTIHVNFTGIKEDQDKQEVVNILRNVLSKDPSVFEESEAEFLNIAEEVDFTYSSTPSTQK